MWRRLLVRALLLLCAAAVTGLAVLDLRVRARFEGERWELPAHIYGRPPELRPGAPLSQSGLERLLAQRGYRALPEPAYPGSFSSDPRRAVIELRSRPYAWWNTTIAGARLTVHFAGGRITRVLKHPPTAAAAVPVAVVRLEPQLLGSIRGGHHQDRALVRLGRTPPRLVEALLVMEDRSFLRHHGIDPRGILRALWANLRAAEVVQGGSTLTQQLVKNFYLGPQRTLARKLVEAVMALLLEARYDKQQILQAYLNEVYLGQVGNRAIHGFGLAARFYFGRPLAELRLHEVALLVGMVRAPSYYDPFRHPQRARQRRDFVIAQLAEQRLVPEALAAAARAWPLDVLAEAPAAAGPAPAFLDLVRRQLRRYYDDTVLRRAGIRIHTTLSPDLQARAAAALAAVLGAIEKERGLGADTLQGALVAVQASSGEVLALAGGRHGMRGFNRALDALRPIGSLIKPVIYLNALERPARYTLATPLSDAPLRLRTADGKQWAPRNYDGTFHGKPLVLEALTRSYNVPAVRVGLDLEVKTVVRTLQRLGVRRPVKPYPAALLGAVELAPLEVAQLYQVLAASGRRAPLRSILSVTDRGRQPLVRALPGARRVVEPGPAYLLRYGLREVTRNGTAAGLRRSFPATADLLGKTGTTNDYRDSWFAGASGEVLAVVWVGRDDNRPTGLSGAAGAMRVWARFMAGLHAHTPAPGAAPPAGIETALIDAVTGLRADEGCDGARLLPFLAGSAPRANAPCARARRAPSQSSPAPWLQRLFGGGRN